MSFLSKTEGTIITTKLTEYGRRKLSLGQLNFSFFAVGDSEFDYRFFEGDEQFQKEVFKPVDFQPRIKSFVKNNQNASQFSPISRRSTSPKSIVNVAPVRGLYDTDSNGDPTALDTSLPGIQLINSEPFVDEAFLDSSSYNYQDENVFTFNVVTNQALDVKFWNLSLIYRDTLIGSVPNDTSKRKTYQYYKSREFSGVKEMFGYKDKNLIALIHYTNPTVHNWYGDRFYEDTPILDFPEVISDYTGTQGLKLVASPIVKFLSFNNTEYAYRDMVIDFGEDTFETFTSYAEDDTVIYKKQRYRAIEAISGSTNSSFNRAQWELLEPALGKCFFNLKVFVIDDEELANTMSIVGKRANVETFPEFDAEVIQTTKNPFITASPNFDHYFTYYPIGELPCLKFAKISDVTNDSKVVLTIDPDRRANTSLGSDIIVLYQKVRKGELPTARNWGELGLYTLNNDGSIILDKNGLTGIVPFNGIPTKLSPLLTNTTDFNYGDENVFVGNVRTNIEAVIYESTFFMGLGFDEYSYTENPTWNESLPYTYITEVGVYDEDQELVMIGKLNRPIKKKTGDSLILNLNIDF